MTRQPSKILIVDDEPHVVHVVRLKLHQAGYEVLVANNARLALELAQLHAPALIITDFEMPGGSGLDLARQLMEQPATAAIPLIMLTARGHRAPLAALAQTSVRSVLAKPFSPRNLLAKVDELLLQLAPAREPVDPRADSGASAA